MGEIDPRVIREVSSLIRRHPGLEVLIKPHMPKTQDLAPSLEILKDNDAVIHPESYNMDLTKMIEFGNFIPKETAKRFRDHLTADEVDDTLPF